VIERERFYVRSGWEDENRGNIEKESEKSEEEIIEREKN